jgi:rhamnogalacturonyl hydrolase YesR
MRHLFLLLLAGVTLASSSPYCCAQQTPPVTPTGRAPAETPAELERMMLRVLDFPYDTGSERHKFDWKIGTFFTGITAAHRATGNPRFLRAATDWSKARHWKLKGTPLFADNLTLGQTYLDLYLETRDPAMIKDTRANLEVYFERDVIRKKEFYTKWKDAELPFTGRNVWWWCDALYMAPPLFVQMYQATGEQRYLDKLDEFYWDVIDYLYDREEHLIIRDLAYLGKKSPGGKKIFWSRGNGWVYAGLVHILERLPENAPRRADYLRLYREMTVSILKHQGADGLWRSALNEPEWFPEKESSGTAFFCFGLLAGVNRGWIPADDYLAPALKAWAGLKTCLDKNGWLGHAQVEAEKPGKVATHAHLDYAQGAYLLAAAEAYRFVSTATNHAAEAAVAPSTWCRIVPERLDDFAWENDLVAFRTYGPAARAAGGPEDSGIDCWLKRVTYPIVEKWYAGHLKGKSYHKDDGEGYDPYHVGRSRGCGGLAIWHDTQMVLSGPFVASKLIKREKA